MFVPTVGAGGSPSGVGAAGQVTLWASATSLTGDAGFTYTGTGNTFATKTGLSAQLGTVSSTTGKLILANAGSAFLTTIQAGAAAAARTYTWPTDFGAAGTVLTDAAGNGTLSWAAAGGGSPGGSGTELQYRSGASTFGAVTGSSVSGGAVTLKGAAHAGAAVLTVTPDSGTSSTSINDNGTMVIDGDSGTGTNILALKSGGATKLNVDYQGLVTAYNNVHPNANNTLDLGNNAYWRSAYLQTSAITPWVSDGSSVYTRTTTLTESVATGFATLTFGASKTVSAEFLCMIEANDGTDYQSLTSRVRVSSVRKSTGNTVSAVNVVGTDLVAESAGGSTLTCTFTVTEGASACTLNANAVSSLAQTTLRISFLALTVGPVTIAKL